jgi:hypothetical protein
MTWQTIREHFPHSWMLLEAIDATTVKGNRIIDELTVVGHFGDSFADAWSQYKVVHKRHRDREYYVLHTDREELDIKEIDAFGRLVTE